MEAPDFGRAAHQYADAGIAVFPLGGDDGKSPLVKRPQSFGIRAALKVAPRFPQANVGIWCGPRSGLTILDVDTRDERELAWALDTFGRTPVIVRTGAGKFHAWYKHAGERRRIRPIKGREIDLLGTNGYSVAPPSVRPGGAAYAFVQGSLADVASLPPMRLEALASAPETPANAAQERPEAFPAATGQEVAPGRRNQALFDLGRSIALSAPSLDALNADLQRLNGELNAPPLPLEEVRRVAGSLWRYRSEGRLFRTGRQSLAFDALAVERIGANGDAALLFLRLQVAHGARSEPFAISPRAMEAANVIGKWNAARYRRATRSLCEAGLVECVHVGGSGPRDPSLYLLS